MLNTVTVPVGGRRMRAALFQWNPLPFSLYRDFCCLQANEPTLLKWDALSWLHNVGGLSGMTWETDENI